MDRTQNYIIDSQATWIKKEDENNFFISVLTIGELHKGIEKLEDSKRKKELHN